MPSGTVTFLFTDIEGSTQLWERLQQAMQAPLARPEQILQLIAPGLRADFPPIKSLNALAHNLPVQLTPFIGREHEMEEIGRLLAKTHLLTLTGSGGTGKTRLTLQVAAESLPRFPDGAWLVELAPVTDPERVVQTVAANLGLRQQPHRPAPPANPARPHRLELRPALRA